MSALCHVWTAPSWQGTFSRCRVSRCSHVFGLFLRFILPLAIMPSADQVPVNNPHSKMQWHKWVVLIAGSTGSALRAVRPPNSHITPDVDGSHSRRKCSRFSIAFAPGHHGPSRSGDLVGE